MGNTGFLLRIGRPRGPWQRRMAQALCGAVLAASGAGLCQVTQAGEDTQWPAYGGDGRGQRFAPDLEITPGNLGHLKRAWVARTGELGAGWARSSHLTFEATPIFVGGRLFISTATGKVLALDPASGRELWRFDAKMDPLTQYSEMTSRGVSYWRDATAPAASACASRIVFASLDARLIELDAASGERCPGFGEDGQVSLKRGVRLQDAGSYQMTSPPAIVGDVIVVGSSIGDNRATNLELGVIRGFDARSGKQLWAFDPISRDARIPKDAQSPRFGEVADQTATWTGAANAWTVFAYDVARDLVFVPTGSASPDYYGGERPGDDRWSDSLVALRASTGAPVWARQIVHHDLWDFDLASQPILTDLKRDGVSIPIVVQLTKMGQVFAFNRETGEPAFPVVETPVPASTVPGDEAWPTQPVSSLPWLGGHAKLTPDDAWGLYHFDRVGCAKKMAALDNQGPYTPPSLRGTIVFPGWVGGSNWGSGALDPAHQILVANTNSIPMVVTLLPRKQGVIEADSDDYPKSEYAAMRGTPYVMRREPLLSAAGVPCIAPPWGQLHAVDLNSGKLLWSVPLGTTRDRAPWPFWYIKGVPNMGGPLVTATGLIFIGAATDNVLRAFDLGSGKELWSDRLPAGGQATPMSYTYHGKQYVLIAAGGHGGLSTTRGDYILAYAVSP